jgi:anti-sigma regulatory factor (Ser/Thr protein kinase)
VSGTWRAVVAAEPSLLAGLRSSVQRQALACGVSPTVAPSVALAVHELVVNSMEHAYGWDSSRTVDVSVWPEQGDLVVRVHDAGPWRTAQSTPGRGLGLRLARELSRSLSVTSGQDGSTVVLRVGLSPVLQES